VSDGIEDITRQQQTLEDARGEQDTIMSEEIEKAPNGGCSLRVFVFEINVRNIEATVWVFRI
jgi:hypothetical protein